MDKRNDQPDIQNTDGRYWKIADYFHLRTAEHTRYRRNNNSLGNFVRLPYLDLLTKLSIKIKIKPFGHKNKRINKLAI